MKILLLGEYSNVHATLAQGLRALGHEVTVASNGDFWKDYPRDIDLRRDAGRAGLLSFLWRLLKALPKMRGYDVVQLINPMFLELKADRLFPIYRYLRRHNKRVVLGAYGMDYYWVSVNDTLKPLRYSDFNIGQQLRHDDSAEAERHDWIGTPKQRLNEMVARDCDAIVAGLYEYKAIYDAVPSLAPKTSFIPFPIQPLDPPPVIAVHDKLRIFVGISKTRSAYKGTDIMLRAVREVERRYPGMLEVVVVEGVPFAEYQRLMDSSDVLIDQLYGYTPAMNALLAMSKGIVVVGGGEPENYSILGEEKLRPIVNVAPTFDSCVTEIERLVLHPDDVQRMKRESVVYVERHHHYLKVAQQYVDLYNSLLEDLTA